MTYREFKKSHLMPFRDTEYIWSPEGFIVWRVGTGGNVELLHIRTFKKRQGHGKRLIVAMLKELKKKPPYYSVYGFSRIANTGATEFYRGMGFHTEVTEGPYKRGKAILFSQSFRVLLKILL